MTSNSEILPSLIGAFNLEVAICVHKIENSSSVISSIKSSGKLNKFITRSGAFHSLFKTELLLMVYLFDSVIEKPLFNRGPLNEVIPL